MIKEKIKIKYKKINKIKQNKTNGTNVEALFRTRSL